MEEIKKTVQRINNDINKLDIDLNNTKNIYK